MLIRRLRWRAWLSAVVLVLALARAADAQQISGYAHRHWDVEEGAPADIRAITQSRDGFLWLGTSNGLYRFDGLVFEAVGPTTFNKWRSNQITALAAAPDGAVWVGYDFGGVGVVREGVLRDANPGPGRPRGSVIDIMVSHDGDVWVCVNGKLGAELHRLHHGRWTTHTPRDWLQPEAIQGIYQAHDGTIWIAQFPSILRLSRGAARPVKIAEQVGFATSFAEDERGVPWLLSAKGLQRLSSPRTLIPFASHGPSAGQAGRRSLLFEDGLAWMAGHQEGMIRLPNLKNIAGGRDIVPIGSRALFRDREGTIWGGGPDGLVNYVRSPVMKVALQGLPATGFVVSQDKERAIYMATDSALYRLDGPAPRVLLRTLYSSALCTGPGGALLVASGTTQHLLYHDREKRTLETPVPHHSPSDCAFDTDGTPWETVPIMGLYKLQDNAWSVQRGAPTGQLLVSNGTGGFLLNEPMHAINRVTPAGTTVLWRENQIGIGFIRVITRAGKVFYMGGEKGIARYDGKRFVSLESSDHPWLSGISGIAIGPADVWTIGSGGIFRVPLRDFEQAFSAPSRPLAHQAVGASLGLTSRSFAYVTNDAVVDGTGAPWFATSRGVARVDPQRIAHNPVPPPITILGIEANGLALPARGTRLPPGTTRIQFDYVALSLINSAANRYRYRLDGVDDGWIDAHGKRQATYTGLGPGKYRFQVIAANNDGVWNLTGATIAITILPYFWQTWWFRAGLLFTAAILLWSLFQWRMHVAAQTARARIEDRLLVREHIAQELHDTLLQGFQGLVLRFQSVMARLPSGHPARDELEATLERADDVLQEGRDRVRYLREETEPVDLLPMLSALAGEVLGNQLRWTIRQTGAARPVCAPVAEDVSRIVGEALFNALRHAQATLVSVTIQNAADSVTICVSDNGTGLDPVVRRTGARTGHYGLVGMRERAVRLGGMLTIEDAEPTGTLVCLTIPARIAFR